MALSDFIVKGKLGGCGNFFRVNPADGIIITVYIVNRVLCKVLVSMCHLEFRGNLTTRAQKMLCGKKCMFNAKVIYI